MLGRTLLVSGMLLLSPAASAQAVGPLLYDDHDTLMGVSVDPGVIITHKGFRVKFDRFGYPAMEGTEDAIGTGYSGHLYFANGGCSGDPYFVVSTIGYTSGGVVIGSDHPQRGSYYVEKSVLPESRLLASRAVGPFVCEPMEAFESPTLPAIPNDPGVTGVPNEPYWPPFRIEMEPLGMLFELMRDGFESSMHSARDAATEPLA